MSVRGGADFGLQLYRFALIGCHLGSGGGHLGLRGCHFGLKLCHFESALGLGGYG